MPSIGIPVSAAPDQNRALNSLADRNHWATPEPIFGWSVLPSFPRAEMAWVVRADAKENAGIYPILVRSTYFCRPSRSAAMIEFV